MLELNDTICALCTAPGGALAVIRVSGPDALKAVQSVWQGRKSLKELPPRTLVFGHVVGPEQEKGEICLAVYMPSPASYTGEDVAEIQCHGGEAGSGKILRLLQAAGVRLAEPGEFTRRAFLNGKMDLTQAEAVADLVSSRSETALRLAEKQLSGALGKAVRELEDRLYHLMAELESRLDFPEEDLDWMPEEELLKRLREMEQTICRLRENRRASLLYREGVRVVIAGSPNSGKSSLLNRLLGYDRAIVSEVPGTTRDTVKEQTVLRGIPAELTDTAGIREEFTDRIEGLGIGRSRESLRLAEVIFWLFDASLDPLPDPAVMEKECPPGTVRIAVWNKGDLVPGFQIPNGCGTDSVVISASEGTGLEKLLDLFESKVKNGMESEPELSVSARHAALLEEAETALSRGETVLPSRDYELVSADVRTAFEALRRITGESADADVLDDIFSRFCIGK